MTTVRHQARQLMRALSRAKASPSPLPLPRIDASKIAPKINVFRLFRPLFPWVLALVTGRHALPSDDVALPPDDVVGLFVSIAGTRSIVRRSLAMDRRALPRTMMGYVVRSSGRHQFALAILSAAVF